MTKKSNWAIYWLLLLIFFLIPAAAFAAAPAKIPLPNPLGTVNILDLGARLIQAGLGIAGSLALLFFIYGGFLWLTSGGSPDKIKKGRDVFLWSVVGLVIIFSSYMMVDFVIKAITADVSQKSCIKQVEEWDASNSAECVIKYAADLTDQTECVQTITQLAADKKKECK